MTRYVPNILLAAYLRILARRASPWAAPWLREAAARLDSRVPKMGTP